MTAEHGRPIEDSDPAPNSRNDVAPRLPLDGLLALVQQVHLHGARVAAPADDVVPPGRDLAAAPRAPLILAARDFLGLPAQRQDDGGQQGGLRERAGERTGDGRVVG